MSRALTLIVVVPICGLSLSACGGNGSDKKDPEAARARQQEARSHEREQRIAQLERRLARLKARDRASPGAEGATRLSSAFSQFEASLHGSAGATLGPPGVGTVKPLGSLTTGSAWSTIKVPIALRVLEERGGPSGLSGSEREAIERALTASDNSAAALLFRGLGDAETATAAVERVLREAGDTATRVSTVGRDGFSPYGQTDWSLAAQHQFMAALDGGCIGDAASRRFLLDLMGRVTSDRWGLGSVGVPARWKGGWGPGTDGRYLARQMGVVSIDGKDLVVTLAALPSDGSFSTAEAMATSVARWIVDHGASFAGPAGRC